MLSKHQTSQSFYDFIRGRQAANRMIYADDGTSFAYERGDSMQLLLEWDDASRRLTISLAPGSKKVWPGYNNFQIEPLAGGEPKQIRFEEKPVSIQL